MGGSLLPQALPQGAESLHSEWALLVECSRPQCDAAHLAARLHVPLHWESFTQLAEDHGTLGLASARLLNDHENSLPPGAAESFRAWRRAQALFTLNLTAEMSRLLDALRASGIAALVIKGPVLSLRCYDDPGLRQYGDLDLIVRDRDILRTAQLMLELGYRGKVPLAAIRAGKIPGEYVFRHVRSKLLVEFHTERTFRYHPRPIPLDAQFLHPAQVVFDGRSVPALGTEAELILICVHGAKHFWERLIYVADVAALVSRQALDWDLVIREAREIGATRMLHVALELAVNVLNVPPPEKMARFLQADMVARRLAAQISRWLPAAGSAPPNILQRAVFRMRMRGSILHALPYLLRLSVSPTEEDWAAGDAGNRHWFLDALRRPFRLARKYRRYGKP